MNSYIYCFKKGMFVKRKFIKTLKSELENEFGKLELNKYIHLDMLFCSVDESYNSYFYVYEQSCDLDRLINVLIKISNTYKLHLSCTLSNDNEKDLFYYIRKQTQDKNIEIRATINL